MGDKQKKGEFFMYKDIKKLEKVTNESLGAVHTHTHTHTRGFIK